MLVASVGYLGVVRNVFKLDKLTCITGVVKNCIWHRKYLLFIYDIVATNNRHYDFFLPNHSF